MGKLLKLVVISFLGLIVVAGQGDDAIPSDGEGNTVVLPSSAASSDVSGKMVVVSTLDGLVSALDSNGNVVWSLPTSPGSMLSSSLAQLQIKHQGRVVQLIPGLDGGLFQLDGEELVALPLTADNLLNSAYSLGEGLTVTGGKEKRTYGISMENGKVHYECGLEGCSYYNHDSCQGDDILLVERHTQTVRVIDSKSGHERWNYSVSQHNIQVLTANSEKGCVTKIPPQINSQIKPQESGIIDSNIKVAVPQGMVIAVKEDNILWQHQFETPVVSAWVVSDGNMHPINLFSSDNIPSSGTLNPSLYIGVHNNQLYVQQSHSFQEHVNHVARRYPFSSHSEYPRVTWMPYLVSSASRTPTIHVNTNLKQLFIDPPRVDDLSTAVTVKDDSAEYPYDSGFYLFNEQVKEELFKKNKGNDTEDIETFQLVILGSILDYWVEILVISIVTAVTINILYFRLFTFNAQEGKKEPSGIIIIERPTPATIDRPEESETVKEEKKDVEFTSRFLTDFTPVRCLGKGGFGVVIEAVNKIDDCQYAIKRTYLPNKEKARERVMREVKALAKLEHMGIVRYYNAWVESPPPGWKESFDEVWVKSGPTSIFSSEGPFSEDEVRKKRNGDHSIILTIDSEFEQCDRNWNKVCGKSLLSTNGVSRHVYDQTSDDSFIVFEENGRGDDVPSSRFFLQNGEGSGDSSSIVFEDEKCAAGDFASEKKLVNLPSVSETDGARASNVFLYIQMQLCKKESLRDWLMDNSVRNKPTILNIFYQIVSAVQYVHDQGLMHRDLKPSNIFFSMDGSIKIGDFGLVTGSVDELDHQTVSEISTRRHTQAVGTQLYMSPEQISRKPYNNKIDVFSLGIIFFELFVSFSTESERIKVLLGVRECDFPSTFVADYKKESAFLAKMLSRDPSGRPTAKEIIEDPVLLEEAEFNDDFLIKIRSQTRTRTLSTSASGSS